MFLFELTVSVTKAGSFQPHKVVGGSTTETKQIAVKPIPEANGASRRATGGKFDRQWTMAGARHILAELLLVRRENADAASPARNGHIPLLRVGRSFDGGVGEQNVIHSPAL